MFKADAKTAIDLDLGIMRADLEAALHGDEFTLDYQPVFSLAGGRPVGVEALLRWKHPRWGSLSPRVFLPVAEDAGLTDVISEFVLGATCSQIAWWNGNLEIPLRISVNVSRQQLRSPALTDLVVDALSASGLPRSSLILELPERELGLLDEPGVATLRALADAEVGLCLDNFHADLGCEPGPGWSSVVQLKTSADLVRDVHRHPRRAAAIHALMTYGEELGLEVVVKGVEAPPQLDWLVEHCPGASVQGYAVSPALAPDRVMEWIRESCGVTV